MTSNVVLRSCNDCPKTYWWPKDQPPKNRCNACQAKVDNK